MANEQVLGVSTPTTPAGDDPVAVLVGEGKKFKTVADLAKGKLESDSFVAQLQEENKALRELASAKAEAGNTTLISELVANLTKQGNTNSAPSTTPANQPAKSGLTEEDVNALIEKRDATSRASSNIQSFNALVSKAFGDKSEVEVAARINAVGADPQLFAQLVAKSPQAALAMLGLTADKGNASSSREGSVNTAALLANSNGNVKNAAYFKELRKTMGSDYYSPKVQQELFRARKEQGDAFYK